MKDGMGYETFAIMREPSGWLREQRPGARPRRMATAVGSCAKEALAEYHFATYLRRFHRQYAGSRFEWRSARATVNRGWQPDDGAEPDTRGREWSLVVTLRNGRRAQHEVRFLAWSAS